MDDFEDFVLCRDELLKLRAEVAELRKQRDSFMECCVEFVRKVECGEARSKRSYAQMKAAIDAAMKEQK